MYPQTKDIYLNKLTEIQRFDRDDWYAVRFSDVQKKYVTTPGFVELNVNDLLKRFESGVLCEDSRSYLLQRTFAALTNGLPLQREELHKNLQFLVDWAVSSEQTLTANSLFN